MLSPGLVVFKDHEAYEKATAKSFRIFGVNIEGVAVTTKPANQCHTLFVENLEMRTGVEMTDALNEALSPRYEVRVKGATARSRGLRRFEYLVCSLEVLFSCFGETLYSRSAWGGWVRVGGMGSRRGLRVRGGGGGGGI